MKIVALYYIPIHFRNSNNFFLSLSSSSVSFFVFGLLHYFDEHRQAERHPVQHHNHLPPKKCLLSPPNTLIVIIIIIVPDYLIIIIINIIQDSLLCRYSRKEIRQKQSIKQGERFLTVINQSKSTKKGKSRPDLIYFRFQKK